MALSIGRAPVRESILAPTFAAIPSHPSQKPWDAGWESCVSVATRYGISSLHTFHAPSEVHLTFIQAERDLPKRTTETMDRRSVCFAETGGRGQRCRKVVAEHLSAPSRPHRLHVARLRYPWIRQDLPLLDPRGHEPRSSSLSASPGPRPNRQENTTYAESNPPSHVLQLVATICVSAQRTLVVGG